MGEKFSAPFQTGPGAHTASCTMGSGSFPGVKSGRGVTLTPHPLLVTWSWKSKAIPLLPLQAVRPLQSPNACTRVHFTNNGSNCSFSASCIHGNGSQLQMMNCYSAHVDSVSRHCGTANQFHFQRSSRPSAWPTYAV